MIRRVRRSIADTVNQRFYYGWAMVGAASLGIFASGPGQSYTFSVFVGPISRDLGVSSAAIVTAYGVATLAAAVLLPYMGRAVDRFGPARALGAVVALLGIACVLVGAAAGFLWLTLGFALLRFLGQGSLMLGCANLVSQWFTRNRGLAMSLMALGFGVSMAIHPPLSQSRRAQ